MKYKIGQRIKLKQIRLCGWIHNTEEDTIYVDWRDGRGIKKVNPKDIEPDYDYRALYEHEKALRECLENLYEYAITDNLIVDHDEWNKTAAIYRQLKQQYNGN